MKKLMTTALISLLTFQSFAWHANGHMTCGAIAYYYLKVHNPSALKKVLATIKMNPWYQYGIWQDRLSPLTGEQKDIALFMLASVYPDEARDSSALGGGEKTKWHYVDYPFVPRGEAVTPEKPKSPNAQEKIDQFLEALPIEHDNAERGIELCWLFHLVEDIHQPLHTVSLFDSNHPNGDAGGNKTIVTGKAHGNLHSFWDDLVKGNFQTVPDKARTLYNNPKYSTKNLHELTTNKTPDAWIQESYKLSKTAVYRDGKINGTKADPTPVDFDYKSNASTIGERRVVLAGIRLARLLEKAYSSNKS